MDRRDFLKKLGLGLVALNMIGLPVETPAAPRTMVYNIRDIKVCIGDVELGTVGDSGLIEVMPLMRWKGTYEAKLVPRDKVREFGMEAGTDSEAFADYVEAYGEPPVCRVIPIVEAQRLFEE